MEPALERIDVKEHNLHWQLKGSEPMVDKWLLMGNPLPVLLILSTYFVMVAVGPIIMKPRTAFKLDKIMLIYNALQVLVAARLVYKVVKKGIFKDGFLLAGCDYPVYTKDVEILNGAWEYFIAKISELLDTVFFVLRKKNNQITFLHVYHHTSMVMYSWGTLKYTAAGDGTVLVFLNCCVHVVMYSYYLLAGLGPRFQKYLWWKKYVTEMQLVQFFLMLTYIGYTQLSTKCSFSPIGSGIIFFKISAFLVLFSIFYYKSYKKSKSC